MVAADDLRHRDDAAGIAAEVVRYLREHPYAADTVEGITRWWLAPTLGAVRVDVLERALESLVGSGHVQRSALGDGRFVYRRGPHIELPSNNST